MAVETSTVNSAGSYPLSEQLRMGQFIDVELQNVSKDRFKTRIIGGIDKEYLVLEQPDIRKYGLLKDNMDELDLPVLRTIFETTSGDCIAFNSCVMCKVSHPDKLLFVSYPEQVFNKCLRCGEREQIKLSACIYLDNNPNPNPS